MKVKDILIRTLNLTDRADIAAKISSGETLSGEAAETVETLLYCLNSVEDELARYYFPLQTTEEFVSFTGKFPFEKFSFRPVKIKEVKCGVNAVRYDITPQYLQTEAKNITVTYEYSPSKHTLEDDGAYDGIFVTEALAAAGTAAEYCLICGEMQSAELWESRYRQEIDRAQKKRFSPMTIPPRRWV